ncbi:MAG: O-antigen ligase family protein [Candidatus Daviesbacteria bacterium]
MGNKLPESVKHSQDEFNRDASSSQAILVISVKMLNKILNFSFYLLFFLVPLLWASWNFELFEYNKMMAVYALTLIIIFVWILKMIESKSLILKSTPLDIPLLLFLAANILSTIFSIDTHTSIFGYYSRLNGGLLSTFSYLLLYWALVSNFNFSQVIKFLKAALWGGLVVALYAIPEHFSLSPSCLILTGQLNASCWVQDVAARVFATLGQPNWLAGYLSMLIFPAFYFLTQAKSKFLFGIWALLLGTFYLAFTFTYSRGATLGLMAGLAVFLGAISWPVLRLHLGGGKLNLPSYWKVLVGILGGFFVISLLFGSALTSFKLFSKFAPPSRPAITTAISGTQLETGGTESGKIRLIVWRGALEIWKAYPIFGSGLETFAYSYYNFRPVEHNLVSEWDFLYNKAHNEFLNYLATTGVVGFLSYLGVIFVFIFWCIKRVMKEDNFSILLLNSALLASYVSYLVQNFFLFSVVSTALLFYLFPALAFIATDSIKVFQLPPKLYPLRFTLYALIYRRPINNKLIKIFVSIIFAVLIFTLVRFYLADTYFATGYRLSDTDPSSSYDNFTQALALNPWENYYRSELGYTEAALAAALSETDATSSAQLKNQAVEDTQKVLKGSPKNVSYQRTAIRVYYLLSTIDKKYTQSTLQALDQTIALAPTDAKLFYNKAMILDQEGKVDEAIKVMEETIKLKPNYKEAYLTLGDFYAEKKDNKKATQTMEALLKIIPGDPDALGKLKEWNK